MNAISFYLSDLGERSATGTPRTGGASITMVFQGNFLIQLGKPIDIPTIL